MKDGERIVKVCRPQSWIPSIKSSVFLGIRSFQDAAKNAKKTCKVRGNVWNVSSICLVYPPLTFRKESDALRMVLGFKLQMVSFFGMDIGINQLEHILLRPFWIHCCIIPILTRDHVDSGTGRSCCKTNTILFFTNWTMLVCPSQVLRRILFVSHDLSMALTIPPL